MLRITRDKDADAVVTLNLAGKIASNWVDLLERECRNSLEGRNGVALDFSRVTFIDTQCVEMLKTLHSEGVQITNCCALVDLLLKGA